MTKFFFFDVDNTIYDETTHQLVPSSMEALFQLRKNGHLVFLSTNRSVVELGLFEGVFDFDGMVTSGGARVWIKDELISSYCLSEPQLSMIISRLDADPTANSTYYCDEHSAYIHRIDNENDFWWYKSNRIPFTGRPLQLSDQVFHIYVRLAVFDDDFLKAMENTLIRKAKSPGLISLYPNKVTKATGIIELCNHLNIDIDDCVSFGDSLHDLEMFELIRESYCVDEGDQQLKDIAYQVIGKVNSDAIYRLCIDKGWIK